jgi:uncharacterized repeat protein (TIGR03833 family)
VAIVLKEDQPTGRRTMGEIANILSPGDFHPRGIKVRLKNGQVGRVQEVLPQLQEVISTPKIIHLVVLLIQRPDMSYYTRKIITPSGEEVTVLGLDRTSPDENEIHNTADSLYQNVTGKVDSPSLVLQEIIFIEEQKINFYAYHSSGVDIKDENKAHWFWTGWTQIDELETLYSEGKLSEESEMLFLKCIMNDIESSDD